MNPSYNDSFGSSQVIASGDDVPAPLPMNSTSKKRRWPLVVIIVLVLIAVGAGVTAVFLSNSNSTNNTDSSSAQTPDRLAFNKYANRLLFNEDSEANIAEFDLNEEYAIDTSTKNTGFLQQALEDYNNFYAAVKETMPEAIRGIPILKVISNIEFLLTEANEPIAQEDNYSALLVEEYKKLYNADEITVDEFENFKTSLISDAVNYLKEQCLVLAKAYNGDNPYKDIQATEEDNETEDNEVKDDTEE